MAKIKLGAIVTEIRGKLGGHVFSKNRSGAYIRTKVTPSNPQTTFQSFVRGVFAAISSRWSQLLENERQSFRDKVEQYQGTDVFGDVKVPSGKTLHHKLNQNLALTGQTMVSICPDASEVPYAGLSDPLINVAAAEYIFTMDNNTTGDKVMIFATPSMSQGTKFVKNKLRMIGYQDGGDGIDIDFKTNYLSKFNAPVAGANVYLGVKVINENGQSSPIEVLKVNVSA